MKLKFIEEKAMKVVMLVTTLLVFLFVGSILYTIVKNGWGAMNWEMISSLPGGGFYIGKEGGLLNAIVGSLYIVGASTVLGLAVSIPVVFYLNVYLKKIRNGVRSPDWRMMCFSESLRSYTGLLLLPS